MHSEKLDAAAIELTKTELGQKIQHHQEVIKKMNPARRDTKEWKPVAQSAHSLNTVNPIRKICDTMAVPFNPNKKRINLHLGDPTLTGKLPPCEVTVNAIKEIVENHKFDGYGPAIGDATARAAVAEKFTTPEAPLTANDIILSSGASHALQMAIEAIADPGDNILIPHPGFPLYSTLCRPHCIEDRGYRLEMTNNAHVDLTHLESLIDENTKAIIVNNPSNPTGVVFTKQHLEDILAIAYKHRVPIIADEIYGDLVYDGAVFYPMATLTPKVPIISCDGLAKRWLVPGWRLGWIAIHDRYNVLSDVRQGMVALSQKIVGPCALVQGALPKILKNTPDSFFSNIKAVLSANAGIVYDQLKNIPGLYPLKPNGAMYMMVGIDHKIYGDETLFLQNLISEESVFCLPGSAFSAPNWFRIVLTYPEDVTMEACQRIKSFCSRRYKKNDDGHLSSSDEGCDIDLPIQIPIDHCSVRTTLGCPQSPRTASLSLPLIPNKKAIN